MWKACYTRINVKVWHQPARGYAIHNTLAAPKQTHTGHAGLVLPPLFVTMVFCFALVLVQQYQSGTRTAAAKQQAYNNKSHRKLSSPSLTPITPLTPITVATPSPTTASTANPTVSAPPQPSKHSGSDTQAAGQHSSPINIVPSTVNKAKNKLGL